MQERKEMGAALPGANGKRKETDGSGLLPLDAAGESINPFASDNSNLAFSLFSPRPRLRLASLFLPSKRLEH